MHSRDEQNSASRNQSGEVKLRSVGLGNPTLCLLLFLAVIPLGSMDIWWESLVLAVIFSATAAAVFQFGLKRFVHETRFLLLPILCLAGYSFLQGIITILNIKADVNYPSFLPLSFDAVSSIWNGLTILGLALFLGLLIVNFRRIELLTWSLIFIGAFFALFGVVRYLLQPQYPRLFDGILSSQLSTGVGFGTYFNQNHFAYLMLMVFGLSIGLFWLGKQPGVVRIALFISALMSWAALVLTGSRGGIISSFAVIAVLVLLPLAKTTIRAKGSSWPNYAHIGRRLSLLLLIFGFLIIGIVLIGQDRVVERIEDLPGQIGGITNASTFRRTDAWQATMEMFTDYPLFGVGFGAFYVAVSQHIDISGEVVPKQAHNDYLEFAASGGLVGIALAVLFLFRFFSLLKIRFAESSTPFSMAARVGAVCGIAGVGLHSFFEFGLQVIANLLFFLALLFLAIHKSDTGEKTEVTVHGKRFPDLAASAVLIALAAIAMYFGFARYQYAQVETGIGPIENELPKIPFDAEYHTARAALFESQANPDAAIEELRYAIRVRPNDYNLWLKLAKAEQARNRLSEADGAFARAIELAPRYAEPHFLYGKYLLGAGRTDQGFAEIRLASLRNPEYFEEFLGLAWSQKAKDWQQLIKVVEPRNSDEREMFFEFLLEMREFAAVAQAACGNAELTEMQRNGLIQQLIEKAQYLPAARIHKRQCTGAIKAEIENNESKASRLPEGSGFGWRFQSESDNTRAVFNEKTDSGNGQGIRVDFNGQDDSFAILSQLVPVEPNRRYRLSFSYSTSKIVTGSTLVVQVLAKHQGSEFVLEESKLDLKDIGWIRPAMEFAVNGSTEIIEIRLARQACAETICPIFGILWLSDFRIAYP